MHFGRRENHASPKCRAGPVIFFPTQPSRNLRREIPLASVVQKKKRTSAAIARRIAFPGKKATPGTLREQPSNRSDLTSSKGAAREEQRRAAAPSSHRGCGHVDGNASFPVEGRAKMGFVCVVPAGKDEEARQKRPGREKQRSRKPVELRSPGAEASQARAGACGAGAPCGGAKNRRPHRPKMRRIPRLAPRSRPAS